MSFCLMALSAQQIKYCQLRAGGDISRQAAYGQCYPKANHNSAGTKGSVMELKPKIIAEIKRLQADSETTTTLTRQEKREFLARVVRMDISTLEKGGSDNRDLLDSIVRSFDKRSNEIKTTYKMPGKAQCIEIDNKMAGHNEPEEHKHTIETGVMVIKDIGATLNDWEKQAAQQQMRLKEEAQEKD